MTGEDELDEFAMTTTHDAALFDATLLQGRKGHTHEECGTRQSLQSAVEPPSLAAPPLNSIHKGVVRSVKPFGAFISIPGCDRDGLIHISKMSSEGRVDKVEDLLAKGDYVWAKVIDHDPEVRGKYCLDMRFISQVDGTDKDPKNVHIGDSHPHKTRDSQPPPKQHKKIELDAILKTTCTRCGGTGHLPYECYANVSGKGKHYELLEDSEEDPGRRSDVAEAATGSNTEPLKYNAVAAKAIGTSNDMKDEQHDKQGRGRERRVEDKERKKRHKKHHDGREKTDGTRKEKSREDHREKSREDRREKSREDRREKSREDRREKSRDHRKKDSARRRSKSEDVKRRHDAHRKRKQSRDSDNDSSSDGDSDSSTDSGRCNRTHKTKTERKRSKIHLKRKKHHSKRARSGDSSDSSSTS